MLSTGDRFASFEILNELGAGGMGEVYRARDAKLGRDVALKVLPEAFTRDDERMARFQREAKVLASPITITSPRFTDLKTPAACTRW